MKKYQINNQLSNQGIVMKLNFDKAPGHALPNSHFLLQYIKDLSTQKEKLRRIGQIMSHDIRQPLACIMGLISAIKEDNYAFDEEMLGMLEKEANDLDKRIKEIVILTD